jgi:hypothetical protein
MKKSFVVFALSALLLGACNKDRLNQESGSDQTTIVGKWNVDTLTTYFYDSSGLRDLGVHIYPAGAPDFPYRFQFNDDDTWTESSHFPTDPDYIAANGTYTITSDSTFTLMYVTAVSSREIEPCKILSLTSTSLVFSKQLTTVFDGTDPGYIKYVFKLTKL